MGYGIKKKKVEIKESDQKAGDVKKASNEPFKDETLQIASHSSSERAHDKEGKQGGKIAGGFGKGKKMNPSKHKLMIKLAKRK